MFNFFKNRREKEYAERKKFIENYSNEMKGGFNMAEREEEITDLNSDNVLDEDLEQEENRPVLAKKGRPINKRQPFQQNPQQQQQRQVTKRFVAVHQSEVNGVFDTMQDKLVAVDIWDMLADMKNDLEEIKRAVGV